MGHQHRQGPDVDQVGRAAGLQPGHSAKWPAAVSRGPGRLARLRAAARCPGCASGTDAATAEAGWSDRILLRRPAAREATQGLTALLHTHPGRPAAVLTGR